MNSMDNMALYNRFRSVPESAQKTIQAGRLKGYTDINPMWRIRCLTEAFGPCGFGWKTEIVKEWIDQGSNEEQTANVEINLYIKHEGTWSEPIVGIGGSTFVAKERSGLYTDDEAFKKAYTDAISVCCKLLGIGADVYWQKDATKYQRPEQRTEQQGNDETVNCDLCGGAVTPIRANGQVLTAAQTKQRLGGLCLTCYKKTVGSNES